MTRRHVDAERQRHSSVLVILLASFTIIRHFFCGALRKTHTLPDLTHRATHDMVIYNVRCSLLSVIKSHNLQNCSSYSQMFLQQVSEIKKTCSPIIITSNWICMKKKKNSSAPGGSFSGGTERLLSMKITWSGFKWIQIDNNERSCRMETHKCHFTEEFLFDSGCPLRLGSIIQHSAFFKPQNKPFKAFQRSSISSWTDPWTPRITGLFFSFLRLKMKEGAPGLLLKPWDDSIHIKGNDCFCVLSIPKKEWTYRTLTNSLIHKDGHIVVTICHSSSISAPPVETLKEQSVIYSRHQNQGYPHVGSLR